MHGGSCELDDANRMPLDNDSDLTSLQRTVAHALRHAPEYYFLEMDSCGWVDFDHLLLALRYHRRSWLGLTRSDLQRVIKKAQGWAQFEIKGNRIRALYGHSLDLPEVACMALPPYVLYHGTCGSLRDAIRVEGLRPMNRTRVQLSSNWNYSFNVAHAKAIRPMVLSIRARDAADSGTTFWKCSCHNWLAVSVPAQFVEFPPPGKATRPI